MKEKLQEIWEWIVKFWYISAGALLLIIVLFVWIRKRAKMKRIARRRAAKARAGKKKKHKLRRAA